MNTAHPNLSYEFYYLLRTRFEHYDMLWQEPCHLSAYQESCITKRGMTVDKDKRLFRWDACTNRPPHSASVEDWAKVLKRGWKNIQLCYTEYFLDQDLDRTHAEFFCNRALIGVALLISDTNFSVLEKHKIRVPLQKKEDSAPDEAVFSLVPKDSSERHLLKIFHAPSGDDSADRMPEPACLTVFHPQFSIRHWQLRLDSSAPRLALMKASEDAPNPIFAVYGLTCGNLIEAEERKAGWPDELEDFLRGEDDAVLTHILPRLMIREWQFARTDLAADSIRQCLSFHTATFNKADLELRCLSSNKLSRGLQDMAALQANAKAVLGNLEKAFRMLEIHRDDIGKKLKRARKHSPHFDPVWCYEDESPLQDGFDTDVRDLKHHAACTRGDLISLDGIFRQWRMHFDTRQLALSAFLGNLHIIMGVIIAVGVAGIISSGLDAPQNGKGSLLSPLMHFFREMQEQPLISDFIMLLSSPAVLCALVVIFLLLVLCFFSGMARRQAECWWRKLRGGIDSS